MKMMRIAMGLALTAAFGLVACGDDSSSAKSSDDNTISCNVKSETPFKMEIKGDGILSVVTMTMAEDGMAIRNEQTFLTEAIAEEACKEAKEDAEKSEKITCDGKKVIVESFESDVDEEAFKMSVSLSKASCKEMNGKPVGDFDDEEDDNEKENGQGENKGSCDFKESDNVWKVKNTTGITIFTFEGNNVHQELFVSEDLGSADGCKETVKMMSENTESKYSCDGSVLNISTDLGGLPIENEEERHSLYEYLCNK